MSRGDKKPVGFATHITAGGIAGGMEAVSESKDEDGGLADEMNRSALLPTSGHDQGPDAALEVWHDPRGESDVLPAINTSTNTCIRPNHEASLPQAHSS